jgi:hypothetical protein
MKKAGIITVLLTSFILVYAQDKPKPQPRTIDFTVTLVNYDGKLLTDGATKDAKPLTLGDVAVLALETSLDEDRQISGVVKFQRDQLARKIYKNKEAVLTIEEIALIRDRIGKVCTPIVVGAAWPLIDSIIK